MKYLQVKFSLRYISLKYKNTLFEAESMLYSNVQMSFNETFNQDQVLHIKGNGL